MVSVHCLNKRHGTSRSDPPHRQMFKTSCTFSQRNHRQSNEIAAFHGYTSYCRPHTAHRTRRVLCSQKSKVPKLTKVARTLQGLWYAHLRHVTQLCHLAQQSNETPKLLKGHRRRTAGGQMGGSPKAPTTASGRGKQHAGGNPESNRGCPGPRDIKRDGHNRLGTSVKPALSDIRPGQGPVSTKVQSTLG